MEIRVEVSTPFDRIREVQALEARIRHAVLTTTGVHAKVTPVAQGALARSEGKEKRVTDRRSHPAGS